MNLKEWAKRAVSAMRRVLRGRIGIVNDLPLRPRR